MSHKLAQWATFFGITGCSSIFVIPEHIKFCDICSSF